MVALRFGPTPVEDAGHRTGPPQQAVGTEAVDHKVRDLSLVWGSSPGRNVPDDSEPKSSEFRLSEPQPPAPTTQPPLPPPTHPPTTPPTIQLPSTSLPPPPMDPLDQCWPAGLDIPKPHLVLSGGQPGDGFVEGSYYMGTVRLDEDIQTDVPESIMCQVVVHELAHHRQYITYGGLATAKEYMGSLQALEHNADCIGQVLGYGPAAGGYGCDNLEDGRRVLAGEMVDRRTNV